MTLSHRLEIRIDDDRMEQLRETAKRQGKTTGLARLGPATSPGSFRV
jgi:hypothetical protein